MTSWLTENKPKFTQRVKLILCLDGHTCPLKQSGVPFSKSVRMCISGSLIVHAQGLVILSVRSKRTVATGEFHVHKGSGLFPEQRLEIKHVVKPGSLTVGLEGEPESALPLDRRMLHEMVGGGSDWGLHGGPSRGR